MTGVTRGVPHRTDLVPFVFFTSLLAQIRIFIAPNLQTLDSFRVTRASHQWLPHQKISHLLVTESHWLCLLLMLLWHAQHWGDIKSSSPSKLLNTSMFHNFLFCPQTPGISQNFASLTRQQLESFSLSCLRRTTIERERPRYSCWWLAYLNSATQHMVEQY